MNECICNEQVVFTIPRGGDVARGCFEPEEVRSVACGIKDEDVSTTPACTDLWTPFYLIACGEILFITRLLLL